MAESRCQFYQHFYVQLLSVQIPKAQKYCQEVSLFCALGSAHVKAARKMLMKSTPDRQLPSGRQRIRCRRQLFRNPCRRRTSSRSLNVLFNVVLVSIKCISIEMFNTYLKSEVVFIACLGWEKNCEPRA